MAYAEFKPSPTLSPYISCFWIFSSDGKNEQHRVLPDASMDIIFNLNDSTSNNSFVSGMMTSFLDIHYHKKTDLMGVRFKTGQFNYLTKIPIDKLKNKNIQLNDVLKNWKIFNLEQLIELQNQKEKLAFMNKLFCNYFYKNDLQKDTLVDSILNTIYKSKTNLKVNQLSKQHFISQRQLERRFKARIGLSVKEYISVFRFLKTKDAIVKHSNSSLEQIAFEQGYYDHAHLSRDFKSLAGAPPSSFRKEEAIC